MKKGDWVQFKSDWGKEPVLQNLGRITRVAKDGSWADVVTRYGRKRIPKPHENLRVVQDGEIITIYI